MDFYDWLKIMGMSSFYENEGNHVTNKDSTIPRNVCWEAVKVTYGYQWKNLRSNIEKAEKKGDISYDVTCVDSTQSKVLQEIAKENGYLVSRGAWISETTFTVKWCGYSKVYSEYNAIPQQEKTKKEPSSRDDAWKEVKAFHKETRGKIQAEIDKCVKSGRVYVEFTYSNKERANIMKKIFEEDGYYCQVYDVSGFWDHIKCKSLWKLSINIIYF